MPSIAPSALVLLLTHWVAALLLAVVLYGVYTGHDNAFWSTTLSNSISAGVGLTVLNLCWETWLFGRFLWQRYWVWAGWVLLLLLVDGGVLLGLLGGLIATFGGVAPG